MAKKDETGKAETGKAPEAAAVVDHAKLAYIPEGGTAACKVIDIVAIDGGKAIINYADFDPTVHMVWEGE
jgi:hypothetical protein